MKHRCYSKKAYSYVYYGARGISVCDEWLKSFEAFQDWALANGYADNLTIDRIDNDGNYCPENCRWVTTDVQNRNKRHPLEHKRNILWEIDGICKSCKEWCKEYGILEQTAKYRVNIKGMSPKEALCVVELGNGRPRRRFVI